MKLVSPSKEHLEKHYADLSDKPFFKGLVTCAFSICTPLWSIYANTIRQTCSVDLFAPWSGRVAKPARSDGVCTIPSPQAFDSTPDFFSVILGATNPLASAPGTIRGDYAIDVGRNVCHGSDGVESAKKEIDLWFKKDEVLSYQSSQKDWIYEKP